ncbi:hypothetical protein CEXT_361681 [Caerostris extrusa]|uniref:Uncharacterized protein n=1 Tax=Caerostris extrusa TaxID=172846 RepID=A0AAV4WFD4_CAEEX|nr:hypothetical protein CEXT_361681 [Caerostris extrusa]
MRFPESPRDKNPASVCEPWKAHTEDNPLGNTFAPFVWCFQVLKEIVFKNTKCYTAVPFPKTTNLHVEACGENRFMSIGMIFKLTNYLTLFSVDEMLLAGHLFSWLPKDGCSSDKVFLKTDILIRPESHPVKRTALRI